MSTSSNQEAMKKYERARDLVFAENNQAFDAVMENNISKMEMLFKTGGIKQEAIDLLIFWVKGVEMMKIFLRYGGDIHKPGPPMDPIPVTLLMSCTAMLQEYAVGSRDRRETAKLIEFFIEEGADLNVSDDYGSTPFYICALNNHTGLCKSLVDRGADSSTKRNNGGNALHAAAKSGHAEIFRYLVEDCGLNIEVECRDENMRSRTPLFLASMHGNFEVCGYLLEVGAKVDGGEGLQPLSSAAGVNVFCFSFP
jgi:ankyrin repeat protein